MNSEYKFVSFFNWKIIQKF